MDAEVFHIRQTDDEREHWWPSSSCDPGRYVAGYRRIKVACPDPSFKVLPWPVENIADEVSEARKVRDRLRAEQELADAV